MVDPLPGTHVFLSTPVLPPEPNDHMKSYNEEKHNDAWEEFYSEVNLKNFKFD
jgi:hypothetical protein